MSVHGRFLRRARLDPSRVALEMPSTRFTYAQVRTMAASAARSLQARGVTRGSLVATGVDEGHLMIIAQLAVMLAGGAFVPIDPNFPTPRMAHMLADSQSSFVIVREGDLSKFTQAINLDTTPLGSGEKESVGDSRAPPTCIDIKDLFDGAGVDGCDARAQDEARGGGEWWSGLEEEEGRDGDVCWIYYTSGSTGPPKGVLCEHRCAVNYLDNHPLFAPYPGHETTDAQAGAQIHTDTDTDTDAQSWHDSKRRRCREAGEGEVDHGCQLLGQERGGRPRVLVPSSFTFDPSAGDIFATLAQGGVLCLASRGEMLGDLGGCLASLSITHVCSTPAVWRTVTREARELPHLRVVALGGEPMPDALVSKWAGTVTLLNLYGTTEATVYQLVRRMAVGDSPKLLGSPVCTGVGFSLLYIPAPRIARGCRVEFGPLYASPLLN